VKFEALVVVVGGQVRESAQDRHDRARRDVRVRVRDQAFDITADSAGIAEEESAVRAQNQDSWMGHSVSVLLEIVSTGSATM
jgi:hypothetical protein